MLLVFTCLFFHCLCVMSGVVFNELYYQNFQPSPIKWDPSIHTQFSEDVWISNQVLVWLNFHYKTNLHKYYESNKQIALWYSQCENENNFDIDNFRKRVSKIKRRYKSWSILN